MKFFLVFLPLVFAGSTHAAVFTNNADADAFVRFNAPAANYGGAGALSVSGANSTNIASGLTNGLADTFIRFNTAAMVTNFNSRFGTNNWVISGAKLQVTEVGSPNNSIFDQGKGEFAVYWVADSNWAEGTGTPMSPTADGIAYDNEPTLLTNTTNLGTFTNAAANTTLIFPLALPPAFITDAQAGGEVTLFLTAIDPQIGFTFNSRTFGTASPRPFLEISALPVPGISAVNLSETDIVLSATNGAADGTYLVLASTNVLLPLNQWMPVASNALSADGEFTITVTNAAKAIGPGQFFILQAH